MKNVVVFSACKGYETSRVCFVVHFVGTSVCFVGVVRVCDVVFGFRHACVVM